MSGNVPQIGVGVLILKEGKILLGSRKGSHGASSYGGPGGKLDFGESLEDCAIREVKEETGLEIENLRVIALTTLLEWKNEGKHFLDVGILADWKSGEPKVLESDKCSGWDWYAPEALPSPLFGATANYLVAKETGKFYFGTIR